MKAFSLWLFKIMYKAELKILHDSQVSMADAGWKAGVRSALRTLDLWSNK